MKKLLIILALAPLSLFAQSVKLGGNVNVGSVSGAPSSIYRTKTCAIVLGSDSGVPLVTSDIQPQGSLCYAENAMTVYQIIVKADSGASTVQLGYSHASGGSPTVTNYTAAVLTPATVTNITDKVACANSGGTAITINGVSVTCSTLASTTWNAGDTIGTVGGAADTTTKRLSIFISATVN